jgi:hypothetical protein
MHIRYWTTCDNRTGEIVHKTNKTIEIILLFYDEQNNKSYILIHIIYTV